jgi:hypothetical protein
MWEYLTLELPNTVSQADSLNTIGARGWELIQVSEGTNGTDLFYFKRPKKREQIIWEYMD